MKKAIIIIFSVFILAFGVILIERFVFAAGSAPASPLCSESGSSYCSTGNTAVSGTCAAGTYSAAGASSCSTCTANYYCPGSTDRIACTGGKVSPAGSTALSDCVNPQCPTGTTDGWSYSAVNYGSTGVAYKPACYHTDGGHLSATVNCSATGVVTITNAGTIPTCNTGYRYTSGGWYQTTFGCYYVCMLNCSAGSSGGYSYNALESGGANSTQTVTRTITNGSCSATATCFDGSVAITGESCSCNAGYYINAGACVQCPAGSYCTGGTAAATTCPTNMTSSAGATAASSCWCTNTRWTSCPYPSCNPAKCSGGQNCNCDGSLANGCEVSYTFSNTVCKTCAEICCGNGVCDSGETAASCVKDCGYCGDGICYTGNEGPSNCYGDCGGEVCSDNSACYGYANSFCTYIGFSGGYCNGGYGYCQGCTNDQYNCDMCGYWVAQSYGTCDCY